jgi:hypothetical protein
MPQRLKRTTAQSQVAQKLDAPCFFSKSEAPTARQAWRRANRVLLASATLSPKQVFERKRVPKQGSLRTNEMPRTVCWAVPIAIASLLGGCAANYIGTGYATVPVQLVVTSYGKFEILDRPELGRVAISPTVDQVTPRFDFEGYVHTLARVPAATNSSSSPGSAYFDPLKQYFAQTGRTCRLIRGEPLIAPQWEFVYDCAPGFDASAVTWNSSGFSNAPLPPTPRCVDLAACAPR